MNEGASIPPPMDRGERLFTGMSAVVLDADEALAQAFASMVEDNDLRVTVNVGAPPAGERLAALLAGAQIAIVERTAIDARAARSCPALQHVVCMGADPGAFLDVEALEAAGVAVHSVTPGAPAGAGRTRERLREAAEGALEQCRRIVVPTGG